MSQESTIHPFSPEDIDLIKPDDSVDILVQSIQTADADGIGSDADAGGTAVTDEGEMFCIL